MAGEAQRTLGRMREPLPMSSKKRNKQRLRARVCTPTVCTRITLRDKCERCRVSDLLRRIAGPKH